jgi:hypothetical protein
MSTPALVEEKKAFFISSVDSQDPRLILGELVVGAW